VREREKLKQLLRERESIIDYINIIYIYFSIYFLDSCLYEAVAYHYPIAHALSIRRKEFC
jgi:hypothetical protein